VRYNPLTTMQDFLGGHPDLDAIETKRRYLQDRLAGGDYLVLTDSGMRKLAGLREEFPVMTGFYDALWGGKTPFEPVATFDRGPALGPVRISDRNAELTFRLFDHPTVYIFRRK